METLLGRLSFGRLTLALALAASVGSGAGCYDPQIADGAQKCAAGDKCPEGLTCFPDKHCYKPGAKPTCVPVCSGGKVCDPVQLVCVECLADKECPDGKVCSGQACVAGCNAGHPGCGADAGSCDVDLGRCRGCNADAECGGATPMCDKATGACVTCLPSDDKCPAGKYCTGDNGKYTCVDGCADNAACLKMAMGGDGGVGAKVTCCNHRCVDLTSDGAHCGQCGNKCGAAKACCASACVDPGTDLANCGQCGNRCMAMNVDRAVCAAGACGFGSCTPGFGDCDGNRANGCEDPVSKDLMNCGVCGNACMATPNATPQCAAGTCSVQSCNMGFADCDKAYPNGCEVNLTSDVGNCGACNNRCAAPANATAGCTSGMCGIGLCFPNFANCNNQPGDGCEVNINNDVNNCGVCRKVCPAGANQSASCVAGNCRVSCNVGFLDCDNMAGNGCEVNPLTSTTNCGGCGQICNLANATPGCTLGRCVIASCNAGFGDCNNGAADGCETGLNNDAKNCGRCGVACAVNQACISGVCTNWSVLLIYASPYDTDVRKMLLNTGAFGTVDEFNATAGQGGTPTLKQLQAYQSVLVYSDPSFADPAALGNVLADYFDGGGQVVVATFANASVPLQGRFGTVGNGYMLIQPGGQEQPNDSIGVVNEPNSPLMIGVAKLSATAAYRSTGGAINGGVVVAAWASGKPLIVRGVVKGRNLVSLNLYPPSVNAGQPSFLTGDIDKILRNALLYR